MNFIAKQTNTEQNQGPTDNTAAVLFAAGRLSRSGDSAKSGLPIFSTSTVY